MKRTAELKPEHAWLILLSEQIKCLSSQVRVGRSAVDLGSLWFVCPSESCSGNIGSSDKGSDEKTSGSVGGPERVSASLIAASHIDSVWTVF